jgi:hypothetical protein
MVTAQGHHHTVRLLRARQLVVCLAALVVCLGACSSGGGKQATPATNTSTPTTAATTTTVSPSQIVANLTKCPSNAPTESVTNLNAGVHGLDEKLVPIIALTVRVCRYPKAVAPLFYDSQAAGQFENATNRFATRPAAGTHGHVACTAAPLYVLTFASNTEQVNIEVLGCRYATNGVLDANPSAQWLNELQTPTMEPPPLPPACPAHQSAPTFNETFCGPTPTPGNGFGPSGECTGRETAPPCGLGMIPDRYYSYTLPGRCDGRLILDGEHWRSELPPAMAVPDQYGWVKISANGKSAGWISPHGTFGFDPDTGQRPSVCTTNTPPTPSKQGPVASPATTLPGNYTGKGPQGLVPRADEHTSATHRHARGMGCDACAQGTGQTRRASY